VEGATWTEHALGSLESAGYRRGGARRAVVELLGGEDCCLTAQEIFDDLRRSGRPVGLASVYRALDVLAELRLVKRIDVGAATSRYEAALPDGDHHHHLVCDDCGRVEAFSDARLENAISRLAAGLGYAVEEHEVVLHGACADCGT